MYQANFFLGYPVDSEFRLVLEKLDPSFKALFIQNGEAYLEEIDFAGVKYLGKKIEKAADISSLNLIEINIYSLLRRLDPTIPFQKIPLKLFPLIEQTT